MINTPNILLQAVVATPVADTVKHVIKASPQITNEGLEVLEKVNSFYESSWDKLLWVIGFAGAIIGIVVPVVIQYWQNKRLIIGEASLKAEITASTERVKKEILTSIDEQLKVKFTEFDEKINVAVDIFFARTFHLQANILIEKNDRTQGISYYIASLDKYAAANDENSIMVLVQYLANEFDYADMDQLLIDKACAYQNTPLKKVLTELGAKYNSIKIHELIDKIIAKYNALPEYPVTKAVAAPAPPEPKPVGETHTETKPDETK